LFYLHTKGYTVKSNMHDAIYELKREMERGREEERKRKRGNKLMAQHIFSCFFVVLVCVESAVGCWAVS